MPVAPGTDARSVTHDREVASINSIQLKLRSSEAM
jgi:hypothetical protein